MLLLIALICNNFYGSWSIKKNETLYREFEDFKIKIISPKISIERFFKSNNENIIIDELIELSHPDITQRTIFIFPEGALAGVNLDDLKNFKKKFSEKFSEKHTIIMGINTYKTIDNSKKVYNSMVILNHKLNLLHEYNKNKLVPFGEFLPFEKFLKKIGLKKISYGYQSFSPAKKRELIFIDSKNFNFIPLICYEIIYSGKITSKFNNTDFIINISEDGWFGNSIGPHQHFSKAIYRSVEEGIFIARSANKGISAFIAPNGRVIKSLKTGESGNIELNFPYFSHPTLFSRYGNKIFFLIIFLYIFLILIFKKFKSND